MTVTLTAITTTPYNSGLAIMLYWLPLMICALGYTLRTGRNYAHDKEVRDNDDKFYYPTDTIGTLIGRGFVTICPIANLWAALFDVSPQMFSKFFKWVGAVFNQPLVPQKKGQR